MTFPSRILSGRVTRRSRFSPRHDTVAHRRLRRFYEKLKFFIETTKNYFNPSKQHHFFPFGVYFLEMRVYFLLTSASHNSSSIIPPLNLKASTCVLNLSRIIGFFGFLEISTSGTKFEDRHCVDSGV